MTVFFAMGLVVQQCDSATILQYRLDSWTALQFGCDSVIVSTVKPILTVTAKLVLLNCTVQAR